jgi:hypothetical protein
MGQIRNRLFSLPPEPVMSATDLFSVENRVVCISGASRGLGKGLATMFAERGRRS